jgi:hypothetical protein
VSNGVENAGEFWHMGVVVVPVMLEAKRGAGRPPAA